MKRSEILACSGVATAVLAFLTCLGFVLPVQVLLTLAVGWTLYLWRTAPQVVVSWPGVATTIVALAGVTVGVHLFARWWLNNSRRAPDQDSPALVEDAGVASQRWPMRRTLAVVAIVVLMFVAGLAMTGAAHQFAWLVTSPEPLTKSGGFEAARRTQSRNNLKQLGLALHNYHDVHNVFPMGGTFDDLGRPHHGWMTSIHPFVEASPLYSNIDMQHPWDHPANMAVFHFVMPVYLIPGVDVPRIGDEPLAPGAAHYAANSHLFGANVGMTMKEITDGTPNTLLVGEAAANYKAWGDPTNLRDPALGINTTSDGFGGPWTGGANVLMADGSVRFISGKMDPSLLRALATPVGGERVPE